MANFNATQETQSRNIRVAEEYDYDVRKLLRFSDELIMANLRDMNIPFVVTDDEIQVGLN